MPAAGSNPTPSAETRRAEPRRAETSREGGAPHRGRDGSVGPAELQLHLVPRQVVQPLDVVLEVDHQPPGAPEDVLRRGTVEQAVAEGRDAGEQLTAPALAAPLPGRQPRLVAPGLRGGERVAHRGQVAAQTPPPPRVGRVLL